MVEGAEKSTSPLKEKAKAVEKELTKVNYPLILKSNQLSLDNSVVKETELNSDFSKSSYRNKIAKCSACSQGSESGSFSSGEVKHFPQELGKVNSRQLDSFNCH